jgi:hypothetical protein
MPHCTTDCRNWFCKHSNFSVANQLPSAKLAIAAAVFSQRQWRGLGEAGRFPIKVRRTASSPRRNLTSLSLSVSWN